MKNKKLILFLCIVLFISLNLGYTLLKPKKSFSPDGKIIIPPSTAGLECFDPDVDPDQPDETKRNSSDPAVFLINTHSGELEHLVMVTSCDLQALRFGSEGNWGRWANYPLQSIYLYTTDMTGMAVTPDYFGTWYDYGPIVTENDFDGTEDAYFMWAPDIIQVGKEFYLYSAVTTGFNFDTGKGTQKIVVAKSAGYTYNGGLDSQFEDFVPFDGFFTGINDNSYAYDPGVFYDSLNKKYYMTYCNGSWELRGKICIAKMNNNMISVDSGSDYGEIFFKNINTTVDETKINNYGQILDVYDEPAYMEGPDISGHIDYYGDVIYVLSFASKIKHDKSGTNPSADETEWIGYATATPTDFNNNPAGCWVFKGWILKNISGSGWTNHANFAYSAHKQKNYIFYHKDSQEGPVGENDNGDFKEKMYDHNRYVCGEEFSFDPDGKIYNLSIINSAFYTRELSDFVTPFIYTKDEGASEYNKTKIRMYLKNATSTPWNNFKLKYYFTADNGNTPWIDDYYTPNSTPTLEHLGSDQWAAILDFNGFTLDAGEMIAENTGGEFFGLQYNNYWAYFNKGNDYSIPDGSKLTMKNNMAVFNNDNQLIYGTTPFNKIKSQYYDNWDINLLTATSEDEDKVVKGQREEITWNSQEWIIEKIPNSANVRLKNLYSGKYLTVKNTAEDAKVVCQYLRTSPTWESQEWIMKKTIEGDFRFQNAWHELGKEGKYLTIVSKADESEILCKTLVEEWPSQRWIVEQSIRQ